MLKGNADESALVQSEMTMHSYGSLADPLGMLHGLELGLALDMSSADIETAIIGGGGTSYRLLTMVKSDSSRQIVDPSAVLRGKCFASIPDCPHAGVVDVIDEVSDIVWTFDGLLSSWEPLKLDGETKALMTVRLDTHAKLNVVIFLGLCSPGTMMLPELC
ncbi:MAG: hypothetical protein MMC33_002218 [Icmadophila ericetorum]|nr:hypothetical protein [Icmadophila ericetorum]